MSLDRHMIDRSLPSAAWLALVLTGCSFLGHVNSEKQQQISSTTPMTPRYTGGDGSSCERAVIVNVRGWREGVAAEYQYLKEKFPGGPPDSQAPAGGEDGRRYDVIEWMRADGSSVRVCFDINQFFGDYESLQ